MYWPSPGSTRTPNFQSAWFPNQGSLTACLPTPANCSGAGLYPNRHLPGETLPQPHQMAALIGPSRSRSDPQSGHQVLPPCPSVNACFWLLLPVGQEGDPAHDTLAQCWLRPLQRGPACWGLAAPRRNHQNCGLQTALSLPVPGNVSFPSNSSRLRGTEADCKRWIGSKEQSPVC